MNFVKKELRELQELLDKLESQTCEPYIKIGRMKQLKAFKTVQKWRDFKGRFWKRRATLELALEIQYRR